MTGKPAQPGKGPPTPRDELDEWIDRACEQDDLAEPLLDAEVVDDDVTSPLSPEDIRKARADLAVWRAPLDFRAAVVALLKRSRSREFFNNPGHQFLRDAFVLAEFVEREPVDRVRLAAQSEQWPDGYVRIGNETKNVEITSADVPGRRIGDEYKFPTEAKLDPVDNWVQRAAAIPGALEKAISAKVAKRYGSPALLIVYLNINEWGIREAETERAIIEIKQRHSASFDGLFVLWKGKLL
jgi:hypothetical protein